MAEQLLRGGIPAVRQAIEEQNSAAKASGQPPVSSDALVAMAEELLPLVSLASWKDRATAAQAAGRSMRLRELRAVVAASRTVSLDEEARVLARALQESLNERVNHLREEWEKRIDGALDAGKVLDALQASARPPEVADAVSSRAGRPPGAGGKRGDDRASLRRPNGWRCSRR